jgi:thioredoxin-related protein
LRKYRIRGFPTLVFVDSSGKIVQDRLIVGFVEADELLKAMRSVQ